MLKIHFMGIGGSGMSGVAEIAKAYGYEVSGCDLKTGGHDPKHLENVDILAVTPAVFFQNAQHPELVEGQKRGIVMTWQQFMGQYLHKNKEVICIAGTHGKSTTTTLAGLLLKEAGLDPTVEVGALVPPWHSHVHIGHGKYFVSEADEYYHNFLAYHPQIIILTMIEMDHPEYFGNLDKVLEAYQQFVEQLSPDGILIYNADDPGIKKLRKPLNSIAYSLEDFPKDLKLKIPGDHNRLNAAAIIKLAEVLKINPEIAYSTLSNFSGIGRRLELLGNKNGIHIYDDYANHPTSYAATLQAVKEKYPESDIYAVIEPHTFSRPKATLNDYPKSFGLAKQVIISKIFASRETDPGDFTGQNIANKLNNAMYIPEFSDIANYLKQHTKSGDIILVMGSGDSSKLARQILENL